MNKKILPFLLILFFISACGIRVVREGQDKSSAESKKPAVEKSESKAESKSETGLKSGEYDFGDFSSSTLTVKGWQALGAEDLDSVLAYTGKCIEMYAKEAKKQQASLDDFAPKDTAFDYWALNDVGTCYFIRASMFMKEGMLEEAKEAYKILADDYYFCQCWDQGGWFWHPGETAKEKLEEWEDY